jgi:hypothetical protein
MRKVIVDEFMSLDGVVQAPSSADEDESGGSNMVDGIRASWTMSRWSG